MKIEHPLQSDNGNNFLYSKVIAHWETRRSIPVLKKEVYNLTHSWLKSMSADVFLQVDKNAEATRDLHCKCWSASQPNF